MFEIKFLNRKNKYFITKIKMFEIKRTPFFFKTFLY